MTSKDKIMNTLADIVKDLEQVDLLFRSNKEYLIEIREQTKDQKNGQ